MLYYHGATYRFFKPPSGEATHNLLALAHDSLVPDLTHVIEVAKSSGRTEAARLRIPFGERVIVLLIEATRVSNPGDPARLLVSFHQEMTPPPASADAETTVDEADYVPDDEVGLLRAAALASSRVQEELTAYNEEMTSLNEELRASNEELETSKEELQSLNEELNTVNAQLHSKVAELQEQTDDLNNLLGSTDVATTTSSSGSAGSRRTPPRCSTSGRPTSDVRFHTSCARLPTRWRTIVGKSCAR